MDEQYIIDLKVKTPGVVPATKKIKELEAELSKLEKTSESYKQKQIEIGRVQNAAGTSTKKLGSTVDNAKGSVGDLTKGLGGLGGVLGIASTALIAAGKQLFDIEKKFTALQNTVGRTSGLVGNSLENTSSKISALAKTFGKDTNEINKAANSFAKQTGVSYTQALSLIEKGLLNGADANGDFLDKIAEYPVQLKNAGFSAEEFIKIASQEVEGGIFGDKLLDSLKEADLALKEQTKATRDALVNAFGSTFTDDILKRIREGQLTTKDALNEIAKETQKGTLSQQQQAQLTADVFKGAGEDAGGFLKITEQITKAQEDNLDVLDKLGEKQKRQLTIQEKLEKQQVRLATTFGGFSTLVDNLGTEALTGFLAVINAVTAEFDILNTKTNKNAGNLVAQFETKTLEEVHEKIKSLSKVLQDTKDDIKDLNKINVIDDGPEAAYIAYRQLNSATSNQKRLERELEGLRELQFTKAKERGEQDQLLRALQAKQAAALTEKQKAEAAAALASAKKAFEENKKRQLELIQLEKDRFEVLKKGFQDNFESQRLEAQKLFLNGLITEEELQQKLFAINQQESDVIITITANKKEIARTGQEGLEISTEEVKKLKEQAAELDRQLAIRQKIKDAERSIQDSEFASNSSELRVEEEEAIQTVLTDTSIKNEVKRQKKLEKVRKEFANKQRQLNIEDTKRQITDAQKAADELQKTLDEQSANGPSEEIDLFKTDELGKTISQVQKLKAELALLNTQQVEADKALKKPDKTLVEKAEEYNSYIQQITQGLQQANQADIEATESSLSAQEVRIQAGIELAKMGNDELLNQELERQEKLLQEREAQANKEKAIAAIQVAANLAVAIAKAAAEGGGFGSIATIAAVLGAVGVGFASIGGLIGGAFADGVIDFKGKGTERSDSNIVAISRGESVITAKGTRNASKMLTMINEGKLSDSDYLTAGLDLNPIQSVNQQIDMRNELNQQINLSRELLEEMRSFYTKVEFTDKGIEQFVNTKNKRITKLNSR